VVWSVAGLVAQPWANRYAAALSAYESAPPPGVQVDFDDDNLAELTTAGGWFVLGYTAAALVLMVLLVRLAVRRPAVADEAVDAALRTRTARVAVGIGFGWLGSAVFLSPKRVADLRSAADWPMVPDVPPPEWLVPGLNRVGELVGFFGLLVAIGCWIWVANPTGRSLATTRVAETDG
jgi:hypothetical protein